MDIFDILGPVMVGPSSSHTAGACRIGLMARTLLGTPPRNVKIHLHGSFADTGAGHGTDRAIVGGLLGMKPDDMRIPQAFHVAEQEEMYFSIDEVVLRNAHPNSVVIEEWGDGGRHLEIQASSIGGGQIEVNKLDGIDVSFDGSLNTLVIRNQDENGILAAVTARLNEMMINVANMSLCRHKRGGDALMVIETDQHILPAEVIEIETLPGIISVTYYDKEDADDGTSFDAGNL